MIIQLGKVTAETKQNSPMPFTDSSVILGHNPL
jgi:hypothetical protein